VSLCIRREKAVFNIFLRGMHSIDEILQSHSIGEIRQLVEELSKNANSKQGELQLMVRQLNIFIILLPIADLSSCCF
jgi:hypothetical protein